MLWLLMGVELLVVTSTQEDHTSSIIGKAQVTTMPVLCVRAPWQHFRTELVFITRRVPAPLLEGAGTCAQGRQAIIFSTVHGFCEASE